MACATPCMWLPFVCVSPVLLSLVGTLLRGRGRGSHGCTYCPWSARCGDPCVVLLRSCPRWQFFFSRIFPLVRISSRSAARACPQRHSSICSAGRTVLVLLQTMCLLTVQQRPLQRTPPPYGHSPCPFPDSAHPLRRPPAPPPVPSLCSPPSVPFCLVREWHS